MGLNRLRYDSIKEIRKRKTNEELQKENEELRAKISALEAITQEHDGALMELGSIIAKDA